MWFFDYEYLKEELLKDIDNLFIAFFNNMLEIFVLIGFLFVFITALVFVTYGLSFFHIINISTIIKTIK